MALPVIKVNNSTGSDAAASGAGPATALTGSAASTSADGLTVTLDGSPDLSGVATDGSAAIYLADATVGNRNFGQITAVDNTGKTVTVAVAFGISLSGLSWAIGGTRASIGGSVSRKLFENNSLAGDAMAGWVVEMESGHQETLTYTFNFRRSGSSTNGAIQLRGAEGAATPPVLTWSNNSVCFVFYAVSRVLVDNFEMRNSNAIKTASRAFGMSGACSNHVRRIRCNHATNYFWQFCYFTGTVEDCDIRHTANHAVQIPGATARPARVLNCIIKDCGGTGVAISGADGGPAWVQGNIIANVVTGIVISLTYGFAGAIQFNTIDTCSADGISFTSTRELFVENNSISNCTGNGINYGTITLQDMVGLLFVRHNNIYNCGAAESLAHSVDTTTFNPAYTAPASDNYEVGSSLANIGHPDATLGNGGSGTRSYLDIGAAQRQALAGTSGYSRGRIVNA
jgi:hypothetical protein